MWVRAQEALDSQRVVNRYGVCYVPSAAVTPSRRIWNHCSPAEAGLRPRVTRALVDEGFCGGELLRVRSSATPPAVTFQ
jgi:hypothetical protein